MKQPRKFSTSWIIIIIVLVVANLTVLAFILGRNRGHVDTVEIVTPYGENFPLPIPAAVRLETNQTIGILALFSEASFQPQVQYLNAILNKFSEQVKVLGVFPGSRRQVARFVQDHDLDFEIIPDVDHEVFHWARVNPHHEHPGFVIYDNQYKAKFVSFNMPAEDLIRQLVEKYVLGKIDYSYRDTPLSFFTVGNPLPELRLTPLRGGNRDVVKLDGEIANDRIVVFFPPKCSACTLAQSVGVIQALQDQIKKSRNLKRKQLLLIFSSAPPQTETLDVLLNLCPDSYVAKHDKRFPWDEYETRVKLPSFGPFVAISDELGQVTDLLPAHTGSNLILTGGMEK